MTADFADGHAKRKRGSYARPPCRSAPPRRTRRGAPRGAGRDRDRTQRHPLPRRDRRCRTVSGPKVREIGDLAGVEGLGRRRRGDVDAGAVRQDGDVRHLRLRHVRGGVDPVRGAAPRGCGEVEAEVAGQRHLQGRPAEGAPDHVRRGVQRLAAQQHAGPGLAVGVRPPLAEARPDQLGWPPGQRGLELARTNASFCASRSPVSTKVTSLRCPPRALRQTFTSGGGRSPRTPECAPGRARRRRSRSCRTARRRPVRRTAAP